MLRKVTHSAETLQHFILLNPYLMQIIYKNILKVKNLVKPPNIVTIIKYSRLRFIKIISSHFF